MLDTFCILPFLRLEVALTVRSAPLTKRSNDEAFSFLRHASSFTNAMVRITLTEPPTGKRKQYDKEGVEMKYGRME